MKFNKKALKYGSLGLIVIGTILLSIGIAMGGSPSYQITGRGLLTSKGINNNSKIYKKELTDIQEFQSIDISNIPADIIIESGEKFQLEYQIIGAENEPSYEVKNSILKFICQDSINTNQHYWSIGFGVNFSNTIGRNSYLKIYVPKDTYIDIIKLNNNDYDIKLTDVKADRLDLQTEYSKIILKNLESTSFQLKNPNGDVSIENVDCGKITLENSYGKLDLRDIQGETLDIKTSTTDIYLSGIVVNDINAHGEYGEFSTENIDCDTLKLINPNGKISVINTTSQDVNLENSYDNIEIKNLSSNTLNVHGPNSDISLQDVECKIIDLYSSYSKINSDNLSAENLQVNNSSGDATFTNLDIISFIMNNSYGDVKLTVNDVNAYDYDLNSSYGDISIEGKEYGSHYTNILGKERNIQIYNDSGNVSIKSSKQ